MRECIGIIGILLPFVTINHLTRSNQIKCMFWRHVEQCSKTVLSHTRQFEKHFSGMFYTSFHFLTNRMRLCVAHVSTNWIQWIPIDLKDREHFHSGFMIHSFFINFSLCWRNANDNDDNNNKKSERIRAKIVIQQFFKQTHFNLLQSARTKSMWL